MVVAAVVAASVLSSAASPQIVETPDATLARYRTQLERLPPLHDMVFQYTESRTGPSRTIVEEHRVYRRADGAERNETIGVNGSSVVPAIVRYTTKADWPYDVRAFAVSAADYSALPIGEAIVDGRRAVGFSTVRTTTGDFAITRLYLDTIRAMPLRLTYDVTGGGCSGTGSIDFGPTAGSWLPRSAKVSCTVGDTGNTFKETIVFHDFSFPPALPADVFEGAPQS